MDLLEKIREAGRDFDRKFSEAQLAVNIENERRIAFVLEKHGIDLYSDPLAELAKRGLCARIGAHLGGDKKEVFTIYRKCKDAGFNLYEGIASVELLQVEFVGKDKSCLSE